MEQNKLKKDLQAILEICHDGVEGYETAANNIKKEDLTTLFLRFSQQRKGFIEELKNEALRLGLELDPPGTVKGFFHRNWLATKATFSSQTNETVIEESITGEKAAVETYQKVLKDNNLPGFLKEILEKQQSLIKGAILQLNGLKVEI